MNTIKMSCPGNDCTGMAYAVLSACVHYLDQTCVVAVTMCPHCHCIGIIEVGLESQEGKVISFEGMSDGEIALMIETWEIPE